MSSHVQGSTKIINVEVRMYLHLNNFGEGFYKRFWHAMYYLSSCDLFIGSSVLKPVHKIVEIKKSGFSETKQL